MLPSAGGQARVLTDTRTADYKARQWIQPKLVAVPSKHGAGVVWAKYYEPENKEPGRKYPIVMFVHGAGYLQNVHQRYPAYFREQMFHNLLVQKGYIVLDMDYRGSEGYGRDWRTAITATWATRNWKTTRTAWTGWSTPSRVTATTPASTAVPMAAS